ncbi:hypothetical protein BV25DRAFT_1842911 [Artomyces pyxidatus]|uniref:Uncharacterized protein n=1 Tax=Artomyces pyxidatus TaxID=48021 RepID=A0ACB8SHI0_9AGAM|nr:hypothetical protein BV25DRAFT_1842911 [Artomyces pyxidatus]
MPTENATVDLQDAQVTGATQAISGPAAGVGEPATTGRGASGGQAVGGGNAGGREGRRVQAAWPGLVSHGGWRLAYWGGDADGPLLWVWAPNGFDSGTVRGVKFYVWMDADGFVHNIPLPVL